MQEQTNASIGNATLFLQNQHCKSSCSATSSTSSFITDSTRDLLRAGEVKRDFNARQQDERILLSCPYGKVSTEHFAFHYATREYKAQSCDKPLSRQNTIRSNIKVVFQQQRIFDHVATA